MKLKKGMIEVFLAFYDEGQAQLLLDTANRWIKCKDAYPSIIEVPEQDFEIKRRVLADKLAKNNVYILADILCVPAQPAFISAIKERFKPDIGMVGLGFVDRISEYPSGVRVCRKGVVSKWPIKTTDNYDKEHANAVIMAGKSIDIWQDIMCRELGKQVKSDA